MVLRNYWIKNQNRVKWTQIFVDVLENLNRKIRDLTILILVKETF